jgi:hypothetical protein
MNFEGPKRRGGQPRKYELTEERREYLLAHYDSNNGVFIARRWGVPVWRVRRWAQELGVARTKEPPWTREQIWLLEEHVYTWSWRRLAKALGRTVVAVKLKAKRLGLGKMSYREGWTQRHVARLLGVDDHKVARWVAQGWLDRRRRGTDRTPQQGGDAWLFAPDALRRFIVAHPAEIDLRRVDRDWFIGLLAAGEPWVRSREARA